MIYVEAKTTASNDRVVTNELCSMYRSVAGSA